MLPDSAAVSLFGNMIDLKEEIQMTKSPMYQILSLEKEELGCGLGN